MSRRLAVPGLGALAALVVFLACLPTLGNGFVDWDDTGLLTENESWRGLGGEQVRWMFTTNHYGHYQPVTWLTYGLDFELWGMNPTGYHLTSSLFHAANTLLVFLVALPLLRRGLSAEARDRLTVLGALFAALLFGLHPLRVESVAWATERRDLVSAFFLLLTVLAYLRYAEKGPVWWYVAALALYVLSMLSKVGGAPLPVVLLVLDWYPLRRIGLYPRQWLDRATLRVVAEKIPFLVVAIGFSVATIAQQTGRWLIPIEEHGLLARTAQAFFGLVFYVWKTVAPVHLLPLYELHTPLNPWAPVFVASFAGVVAVTVAALVLWRRGRPALLAVWLCYGAMLGPLLGFFQNGPQITADRYSYLSTLGWLLLAAAGVVVLARRAAGRPRLAVGAAAGAVLVTLAVLTWRQCLVWRDTAALWSHTYRHDPGSSLAANGYGYVLLSEGRIEESVDLFRQAIRIRPTNAEAHENLWDALQRLGRSDERRLALIEASTSPRTDVRARALYLLGTDQLAERQNAAAAATFRTALSLVETHAPSHVNLAVALMRLGLTEEAIEHYLRAIELDRTLLNARDGLAWAYATQGRTQEAVEVLKEILKEAPDYQPARRRFERLLGLRDVIPPQE